MTTDEKIDLVLELLKEFKSDVNKRFDQVDKRFEQVDKRFEQVDKRFEQIDKRFEQVDKKFEDVNRQIENVREEIKDVKIEMKEIKHDVRSDRDKLQEVYESRDKVKITFGWQWGMVSLFIAITAGAIVKIFA